MHIEQLLERLSKAKQHGVLAPVFGVVAPTGLHIELKDRISQMLEVEIFDIHLLEPLPDKLSIGVKQAKKWQNELYTSSRGQHKVGYIIPADKMTTETASSLLKLLEEPPRNCFLVLIMSRNTLIPTIRSRLHAYSLLNEEPSDYVEIPNTLSAIIKTAGNWASDKSVKSKINDLLPTLRDELKAGRLTAGYVQLVLHSLTQASLGLDQKLLAEKILLSYDI